MTVRMFFAGLAVLALSGCGGWHYTVNAPLERYDAGHGYRFVKTQSEENSDGLFIVLTFSGGGMRAASQLLNASPDFARLLESLR